jgi:hypothetical protein
MRKKKRASIQQPSRHAPMLVLAVVAGIALVGLLSYWAGRSDRALSPARTETQDESEVPPFFSSAEAAVPLPKTLSPDLFSQPYVARAYRAAERIPSVLAQQPCYCHCHKFGHRSLLDCFTTKHGAG